MNNLFVSAMWAVATLQFMIVIIIIVIIFASVISHVGNLSELHAAVKSHPYTAALLFWYSVQCTRY